MTERVDDVLVGIARRIVDGEQEPYDGAAAIWRVLAEAGAGYPSQLRAFVGLASEWQDHPEHRAALEADIRDEAATLLQGGE